MKVLPNSVEKIQSTHFILVVSQSDYYKKVFSFEGLLSPPMALSSSTMSQGRGKSGDRRGGRGGIKKIHCDHKNNECFHLFKAYYMLVSVQT